MEIQYAKLLGRCAAYPLVMRGLADLAEAGHWAHGGPPVHWENEVLWVERDARPVGVMVYCPQPHYVGYFINLGYVLPDHRRRGIYRALWDALVVRAREAGVAVLVGSISQSNKPMQLAAERLGRTANEIVYRFEVPPA